MNFEPITITRLDADHYIVGRITLTRMVDAVEGGLWAAVPPPERGEASGAPRRPLFTAPTLEEILDLAHGACEMMRPAPGYWCEHNRSQGDCPECVDDMVYGA